MYIRRNKRGEVAHLVMRRHSNFHAHLRLGHLMRAIAYEIMWKVKYLVVMPNDGVIDTIEKLHARHSELRKLAMVLGVDPTFIMTVYLTANVTPHMIEQMSELPFRVEVKYYPPQAGATTGSGHGIPLSQATDTLRAMADSRIPLLGHFESMYDKHGHVLPPENRESYFLEHEYPVFRDAHPALLVSIEHGSTGLAVRRVKEDSSGNTVTTFTPHHLLLTIKQLRRLSWANHGNCMPIPKGPDDVEACKEFATSGDRRAIAGDDTAAHLSRFKRGHFNEVRKGCYWKGHSLAAYATVFHRQKALHYLEAFASLNGVRWRGLPLPDENETVTLVRETERDIPDPTEVPEEDDVAIPLGWTTQADRLRIGLKLVEQRAL